MQFANLAYEPLCVLYLIQATTYLAATIALRYSHGGVAVCYVISAAVHLGAALVYSGLFS